MKRFAYLLDKHNWPEQRYEAFKVHVGIKFKDIIDMRDGKKMITKRTAEKLADTFKKVLGPRYLPEDFIGDLKENEEILTIEENRKRVKNE